MQLCRRPAGGVLMAPLLLLAIASTGRAQTPDRAQSESRSFSFLLGPDVILVQPHRRDSATWVGVHAEGLWRFAPIASLGVIGGYRWQPYSNVTLYDTGQSVRHDARLMLVVAELRMQPAAARVVKPWVAAKLGQGVLRESSSFDFLMLHEHRDRSQNQAISGLGAGLDWLFSTAFGAGLELRALTMKLDDVEIPMSSGNTEILESWWFGKLTMFSLGLNLTWTQ